MSQTGGGSIQDYIFIYLFIYPHKTNNRKQNCVNSAERLKYMCSFSRRTEINLFIFSDCCVESIAAVWQCQGTVRGQRSVEYCTCQVGRHVQLVAILWEVGVTLSAERGLVSIRRTALPPDLRVVAISGRRDERYCDDDDTHGALPAWRRVASRQ